jgi:hypothetical protein
MSGLILGVFFCVVVAGGVLVALVVVLVVTSSKKAQERRSSLQAYAAHREWTYLADDPRLVDRFPGSPFGLGRRRQATNVLHGTQDGRPVTAFDYSYVTGGGGDAPDSTHGCSVLATSLGLAVPTLTVSPRRGLGAALGTLFGGTDLVVGDPAFDAVFTVYADDPRFATDVLHPAMTAMLLQWPNLTWRLTSDSLLLIRGGRHSPAEIDGGLVVMQQILGQVPPAVWANLRAAGPQPG